MGLPLDSLPPGPVIIDEIGRMECFSSRFRELVPALLDWPGPLLATVALRSSGFIAQVKARTDIRLVEITLKNRNDLISGLTDRLKTLVKPR